jgi:hypothetical protein
LLALRVNPMAVPEVTLAASAVFVNDKLGAITVTVALALSESATFPAERVAVLG